MLNNNNAFVVVLKSHAKADVGVKEFKHCSFAMPTLSSARRDYHPEKHASAIIEAWVPAGAPVNER